MNFNSNYADAINKLKEATHSSKVTRKCRYEAVSTDKLLSSQAMKHHRQPSQVMGKYMMSNHSEIFIRMIFLELLFSS